MIYRCVDINHPAFKDYGGRGIQVCEEWMLFENFLRDMGQRPPDKTIDRIDVDGGYEKSNCRWASKEDQARNKRNIKTVTYQGREYFMPDLARELGMNYSTLRQRVKKGLSIEAPIDKRQQLANQKRWDLAANRKQQAQQNKEKTK